MESTAWTAADRQQLTSRNIPIEEADRQIRLLSVGADPADLARPCSPADGVLQLSGAALDGLIECQREAADTGRFERFVPASGAATRMFKSLIHFSAGPHRELSWAQIEAAAATGDGLASDLMRTLLESPKLPFADELDRRLGSAGGLDRVVETRDHMAFLQVLLGADGMGCASKPKGLLPFHLYADGPRTPVEEHLAEAASYASSASGLCRVHFTVSAEHRTAFVELLEDREPALAKALGCSFETSLSTQHSSTDTLAGEVDGGPARDDLGRLQFRPGGHGALLENLGAIGAEFVYVKNIDNVQPAWRRDTTRRWKRVLGGLAVDLQAAVHHWVRRLRQPEPDASDVVDAERFCRERLGLQTPSGFLSNGSGADSRHALLATLDRPLRVCGVVRNTGEPGGGPFWVRGPDGRLAPQIVESAQVDLSRDDQREIFNRSTHFNPVDLVCGLRDAAGRAFDLIHYVDPNAVIISRKSAHGRELLALERPGLWNGAMAGWITVFVEVPLATFSPVKSILDLLRAEHQPD